MGDPKQNVIWMWGLVERHKIYYKGEGGGFPQVRAMVSLVNPSCPWLVLAPKVLQLCTNCLALLHIVPFCEGLNKKPERFTKQKQSAIFAMRHASQLVVHHPSLIYNVPLIIAALLRHIRQTKLCDPLNLRPP